MHPSNTPLDLQSASVIFSPTGETKPYVFTALNETLLILRMELLHPANGLQEKRINNQ